MKHLVFQHEVDVNSTIQFNNALTNVNSYNL